MGDLLLEILPIPRAPPWEPKGQGLLPDVWARFVGDRRLMRAAFESGLDGFIGATRAARRAI